MKTTFNSIFAESMRKFVEFKKASALSYVHSAKTLLSFDKFACEHITEKPFITDSSAKLYLNSISLLTPKTQYNRMCVLRQFSAFHHLYYPQSTVLSDIGVKKQQSVRFIVLQPSHIAQLMAATEKLNYVKHYADAMKTLIALLYCAALRISEALALNVSDFDPVNATICVHSGKFRKQRSIPLHASTQTAISHYLVSRHLPDRIEANTPLFADNFNKPITYNRVYKAFNRLLDYTNLRQLCGPVRLHDLRHSFASNVLRQAIQNGVDTYAMLPKIATFMGHVQISSSQIYLHTDPGCLAIASSRFHDAFFNSNQP